MSTITAFQMDALLLLSGGGAEGARAAGPPASK